jgi:hypothetical protein
MAASDREFLLQIEGIQTYGNALRQNRSELPAMIYLAAAVINSR